MGDGHETESAVERLLASWRGFAKTLSEYRAGPGRHFANGEIYRLDFCIDELQAALEEDGVIPTRK